MSLDFGTGGVSVDLGSDPEPWMVGSVIILNCELTGSEDGLTSRWHLNGAWLQDAQAGMKPWVVDTTSAENSGYYGCYVADATGYLNASSVFVEIFASPIPTRPEENLVSPSLRELEDEGVECLPSDQEGGSD